VRPRIRLDTGALLRRLPAFLLVLIVAIPLAWAIVRSALVNQFARSNPLVAARIAPDDPSMLGIAIDVYHCWWDPLLSASIAAAGRARRILAYHVCDWHADTKDMLMDRGMMGDGVIDLAGFRREMEDAGYAGMMEVEIFSRDRWWKVAPDEVLAVCAQRLQSVC